MKSLAMKSLLLFALASATSTACFAQWPNYVGFWVIGNSATKVCEIVTTNPVLPDTIVWFVSGPYKSLADAKIAQSTISICPKPDPTTEPERTEE